MKTLQGTVLYTKVDDQYVPYEVIGPAQYERRWPIGSHLVQVSSSGSLTRYNIQPNIAELLAAGLIFEDAVAESMLKASELRSERDPLTEAQVKAWHAFIDAMEGNHYMLRYPSIREIAQEGTKALIKKTDELRAIPAVSDALDNLHTVISLTRDYKEE